MFGLGCDVVHNQYLLASSCKFLIVGLYFDASSTLVHTNATQQPCHTPFSATTCDVDCILL